MTEHPIRRYCLLLSICFLSGLVIPDRLVAQSGTLAEPFPAPAPNAALHYQRALLHLSTLDGAVIEPLAKPIWEVAPATLEENAAREINRLLGRGRFAIQAAATGSRTAQCNFGIDFSGAGAGSQLPHQPLPPIT